MAEVTIVIKDKDDGGVDISMTTKGETESENVFHFEDGVRKNTTAQYGAMLAVAHLKNLFETQE